MPLQLQNLSEIQMREIHAGLLLREDQLKKARKTYIEAGLNAQDAEYHLTILQGGTAESDRGLLYLTQSQLDAIVESDLRKPLKKGDQLDMTTTPAEEPAPAPYAATSTEEPNEFEVDVRAALGDERLMFALDYAMNASGSLSDAWGKDQPMTDDELGEFVGAAFTKGGSNAKDGPVKFAWRGGGRPAIWLGQLNYRGTPTLIGDALLEVVRRRYEVGRPMIGSGATAPDVPAPGEAAPTE